MDYFVEQEFLPPSVWESEGVDGMLHIDPRVIETCIDIRRFFARPVTVNNWHVGGPYKYRCYRPRDCPVGAKHSLHKEGLACDLTIKGISAAKARRRIIENSDLFPFIRRLEDEVGWVHFDAMETGRKEIVLFRPQPQKLIS